MRTFIIIFLTLIIVSNHNGLFSQEQGKDTLPASAFIVDGNACVNDELQITYTGNAGENAIFNWKFDGTQIVSGAGRGPYVVKWAESGVKKIELFVEDEG